MKRLGWIFVAALLLAPGALQAQDIRSPDPWQMPRGGSSGSSRPTMERDMPTMSAPSLPDMDRDTRSFDLRLPDSPAELPPLEPEPTPELTPNASPKR